MRRFFDSKSKQMQADIICAPKPPVKDIDKGGCIKSRRKCLIIEDMNIFEELRNKCSYEAINTTMKVDHQFFEKG